MKRAIAALLLALPLLAQRNDSIHVTLIEVPVTVIDRDGNPVRNLTAANFELYDEGQRRPITHFETIDLRSRLRVTAVEAATQTTEGPRPYMRNFMLLFDLTDSAPGSLVRAREAATAFLEKLQPVDRVAVGTVSVQSGFRLLANFTLDREFVRALIATLGDTKQLQPRDPLLLSSGDLEYQMRISRRTEVAEHYRDLALEAKRTGREEQRHVTLRRIDNLAELGRVLDRVSGRKQVVLLSEGFDTKAIQGREDVMSEEAQRERAYLERGEWYRVDTDARYGSSDALTTLKRMTETLKRSDVILHALDIKGIRNALDEEGQRVNSTESLSLLTRDTGGTVFKNTNDLGENFTRMLAQQDVTYILGFQTSANASGKFHNLRVKLIGGPDGARVTHRQGYYEQSRATLDLDRALTAGEILSNAIPVDDVRVRAFTAAFPHREGIAQAPVVLEIDGPTLLAEAKGDDVPAEIFVYAFDRNGVARDFVTQSLSFDLRKLRAKLEGKGVKFYHTLLLPPGDYSVRALVRTEAGRSGFASVPLHVAEAGEAAVAPALLDDTSGWVMVKAPDRGAAPAYPFVAGETTFVPAAMPRLEAGKAYELALMTHSFPVENLQIAAKIEGNGATHTAPLSLLGRTPPDATGGVKVMVQVTPPTLSPGAYRLVMTLRARDNAPERTVAVPFEVQ
ncbi:MAG: VWA domain-containing protein [Thermoanaerobaculia bacterium]